MHTLLQPQVSQLQVHQRQLQLRLPELICRPLRVLLPLLHCPAVQLLGQFQCLEGQSAVRHVLPLRICTRAAAWQIEKERDLPIARPAAVWGLACQRQPPPASSMSDLGGRVSSGVYWKWQGQQQTFQGRPETVGSALAKRCPAVTPCVARMQPVNV